MRISLPQHDLARGVITVGRGVGTAVRKTVPGTGHILLATDEGRLRLSATDLEIGITLRLAATIEEEGATVVPARLFAELVNSLPDDRVDLARTDEAHATAVACARVTATVRGGDPDEFPRIPAVGDGAAALIPADLLRTAIGQVAFAAATDDARPVFTGVLVTVAGATVTLAAADGVRLAVRSAALAHPVAGDIDALIPARALAELARILPEGDEPVEMTVTPNRAQVLFHTGSLDLVSRVIEGRYVDYSRIIPQAYATRAIVDIAEFKGAIRTAPFFARDDNNIVRLSLTPGADGALGTLTIGAAAADAGDTISQIDAAIEGEPQTVAFNIAFIADALGALPGEQAALELSGPAQPGVLRPLDGSDYLCVVMAMSAPR